MTVLKGIILSIGLVIVCSAGASPSTLAGTADLTMGRELIPEILARPDLLKAYAADLGLHSADASKFLRSLHRATLKNDQNFVLTSVTDPSLKRVSVELAAGTEVYSDSLGQPSLRASDGAILTPDSAKDAGAASGGAAGGSDHLSLLSSGLFGDADSPTDAFGTSGPWEGPDAVTGGSGAAADDGPDTADSALQWDSANANDPQDASQDEMTASPAQDPAPIESADALDPDPVPDPAPGDNPLFAGSSYVSPLGYFGVAGDAFMVLDPTGNVTSGKGQPGHPQSTPEPSSLLTIGAVLFGLRRRRKSANHERRRASGSVPH